METSAILLSAPQDVATRRVPLTPPGAGDLVVRVAHSGISTGTEKLFWSGAMPPFPGMGYPLVPGYEACGEIVEAGSDTGFKVGETVFVPGANCFGALEGTPVHGLFGGAAEHLVTKASRVSRIDPGLKAEGALLALAATARHALAGPQAQLPDLIVGHGVLGRLLARLTIAAGGPAPTVWEIDETRRTGAQGYEVIDPAQDPRKDYACIIDASGAGDQLNSLIARLQKGGEVVLAGFYAQPLSFAFPPAFMREARLRIAAEWRPDDLAATRALIDAGALSLGGLITHRANAHDPSAAYDTAFNDSSCLKMILDWNA